MGIKRYFQREICFLMAMREYWCDGARQAMPATRAFELLAKALAADVPRAFHLRCWPLTARAAEIDAAATDGPVSGIKPEYILVCKATDELSNGGTLRDETLRELLDKYGETISRKIVLMIGWFNMLSLFLNGRRLPLETTDKVGTRTSPLG